MSKTRLEKAVLRGDGFASARAVNAEPWGPPFGMVKRQCRGSRR